MNAKTGEFLNFLLWSSETLLHPTFRNLSGSYEEWAYGNGLRQQIFRLERQRLLERDAGVPNDRLYRLTPTGRLQALGGRDPEERLAREWDGQWRLVLFDVPSSQNAQRERLRRYLRERHFGCLQNSVWISPDPLADQRESLAGGRINVKSLVMMESRAIGGESDVEIAAAAWNFEEINRRYARHLKVLDERPASGLRNEAGAKAFHRWVAAEREAWLDAVTFDPLLPKRLLPTDYAGQHAWQRRVEALQHAAKQLRTFERS